MGNLYNLPKQESLQPQCFINIRIIFFITKYFKNFFFNPIARVSFITYKDLHHFDNVNIRKIFQTTKFIFVRISGFLPCWTGHSIGFIIDGFNSNICCVGRTRTTDLQVMSLTSYLCSIPRCCSRYWIRTNVWYLKRYPSYSLAHLWIVPLDEPTIFVARRGFEHSVSQPKSWAS